jgi:hypothetical protein
MPELNETMELVKMPGYFSDFLVKAVLLDLSGAFAVEYICNFLFSDNKPSKSLGLDDTEWENLGKVKKSSEEYMVKTPSYRISPP